MTTDQAERDRHHGHFRCHRKRPRSPRSAIRNTRRSMTARAGTRARCNSARRFIIVQRRSPRRAPVLARPSGRLYSLFQQARGMPQRGLGLPAEHPRNFFVRALPGDFAEPRMRPAACNFLRHNEMCGGRRRHLRQMRNAKHLMLARASVFILAPTAFAISPPTFASISSKTSSGIASCAASDDLIASISREISPLEAIVRNGFNGSPGFGEKSSSIASKPVGAGLGRAR